MKKRREDTEKNVNEFECPSCGNPLFLSNRDIIRCKYCDTAIIPRGTKELRYREPQIYNPKSEA